MKRFLSIVLLVAAAAASTAGAQTPADRVIASEAVAGNVTLPASTAGALVMSPCFECAPKSFRASATTTYFIGDRQVTLEELKADVIRRPQSCLTVSYTKTGGALVSVSAEPLSRSPSETR